MKVSKTQLQEMVNEAVSSYLKENAQDQQIIAGLEPVFNAAIKEIESGMRKYHQVMQELSMASSPHVKEIGERGVETIVDEMERWRARADDMYVAKWQLDYDNTSSEDRDRIAQYSDEHDNRDTLGEPKV